MTVGRTWEGRRRKTSRRKRRAECRDRSVILLDSARSPVTFECSLDFTSRRRERREEEEHREGEKTRTSISFAFSIPAVGSPPRLPLSVPSAPPRISCASGLLETRFPREFSARIAPRSAQMRPRRPGKEERRRTKKNETDRERTRRNYHGIFESRLLLGRQRERWYGRVKAEEPRARERKRR